MTTDTTPTEPGQTDLFQSAHTDAADGALRLPSPTPGILEARDAAAASAAPEAPAPAASGGQVDAAGVAFDPARHEVDKASGEPKRKADGTWSKKRGNGARAAAGKPMAGAMQGRLVIPPEAPAAPAAAPAPAVGAGPVVGVEAAPAPILSATDCEPTAAAVTHGLWGIAETLGGPAWRPEAEETRQWTGALARLWERMQWPLIGPMAEVLILAVRSVAKRSDGAGARRWLAGTWRWMRGGSFAEPQRQEATV